MNKCRTTPIDEFSFKLDLAVITVLSYHPKVSMADFLRIMRDKLDAWERDGLNVEYKESIEDENDDAELDSE